MWSHSYFSLTIFPRSSPGSHTHCMRDRPFCNGKPDMPTFRQFWHEMWTSGELWGIDGTPYGSSESFSQQTKGFAAGCQFQLLRRVREFTSLILVFQDENENFLFSVLYFETKAKIFPHNLTSRDEIEKIFLLFSVVIPDMCREPPKNDTDVILHGVAWYCVVLHSIAWYCMELRNIV